MPLLFFIGCSEDADNIEPAITLGDTEVVFSQVAESRFISVSVDTGHKFTATWSNEGATWGEVIQKEDGSGVTIYVSEHSGETSRIATVRITTEGDVATKFIRVHQNGINSTLDILPETLLFNQLAASKAVEVTTDAKYWSVSGETDWLTISMERVEFNEVVIVVAENTSFTDRVAKLIVTAGGSKKEIFVTQAGAMDLILPFLRFDITGFGIKNSIKEFEEARGSKFIVDGGMFGGVTYRTLSPNFPEMGYYVGFGSWDLVVMQPSNWEILQSEALHNMLSENGFKYIYTSANSVHAYFWREADRIECIIDRLMAGEIMFIGNRDEPIDPAQTESYPTFEEMPTGLFDWSSTKSEIEAWETAAGSTLKTQFPLDQGYDQFLYTTSNNNPRKEFERAYWIFAETNQYVQTMLMYEDITLAYFLNIHNEYVMTREFKKWLADNGFEEVQGIGSVQYLNKATNIRLLPDVAWYVKNTGDEPVITLLLTFMKGDYRP